MTKFTKSKLYFVACIMGLLIVDLWHPVDWFYYLIPVVLFILILVFGTTTLSANLFTKSFTQPEQANNKVALTFDDGPNLNTLQVLKVLKKHQAKATFFCIGHKIEKHPDIMQTMVSEGHCIGNHSYTHSSLFPLFSPKKIKLELEKTSSIINEYAGTACRLFRPPFGVINPRVAKAANDADHKIIGWNLRTFDTSRGKSKVLKKIRKQLKGGSVVLLHDDRAHTGEVLEEILLYGKAKGFTFVTVEDIFEFQ